VKEKCGLVVTGIDSWLKSIFKKGIKSITDNNSKITDKILQKIFIKAYSL